jgi:hypothetical protein
MNRANGIRFTEQDVSHLGVLCSHLSQIFTYIFREGLLAQLSQEKQAVLANFVKTLSHKHKDHMKHFFREILAFKFGKLNLLKNKIMRKYLDRHMKID